MSKTTTPPAFDLTPAELYARYRRHLCRVSSLGLSLDISRMPFDQRFFKAMEPAMEKAYAAMADLEGGAIANPDEGRMVGHYWLRDASLAPTPELREAITQAIDEVRQFAAAVHKKQIIPPKAARFTEVLSIGIGGSALGPQFVSDALGGLRGRDKLRLHFLDNTDPDGIRRVLAALGTRLKSTLVLVISKSGTTPEPRNGMIETKAAFDARGLDFAKQAVAVTGEGSKLDEQAKKEGWLKRFPMWDWVGGRTSVMATVGLLPMALQGLNITTFLDGAARMDRVTRGTSTKKNPAALLALMWYLATDGSGEKDMVMLPYKDRLLLLSRYLQQLVMESLGKKEDLDGNIVHQGIAVYGNKGSTDQHAYVQQLRDGINNFFATFVVALQDARPSVQRDDPLYVQGSTNVDGVTAGDYLNGFWQGTRTALFDSGRGSMTLTINKVNARSVGALIALYERAVGFYATLINVNAYHQPGVEAGKKAATAVLKLQQQALQALSEEPQSIDELADAIGQPDAAETLLHLCEHLVANDRLVKRGTGYARVR